YFTAPLAAMPSLHFAAAFVMAYYAWRAQLAIAPLAVAIVGWISIESVVSRWHYLVDLPAGLVVAAVAIAVANRLCRRRLADPALDVACDLAGAEPLRAWPRRAAGDGHRAFRSPRGRASGARRRRRDCAPGASRRSPLRRGRARARGRAASRPGAEAAARGRAPRARPRDRTRPAPGAPVGGRAGSCAEPAGA